MSMISAQINELRLIADKDTVPYEASDAMYQAADTIWQLRDDLQRANAAVQDAEHDESMAWDRVRKAEAENAKLRTEFDKMDKWHSAELQAEMAENAKLRELVRDYEHCSMHADCDRCEYDGTTSTHCPLSPCFPDIDELNKLGIEVGE